MTEEKRPEQNEQDATEETQETEVSVVSEATESSDESPGFAFGDDAVQKYPTQVQAALEYAESNKYEYGPRLRELELIWDVISVEPMSNGIVRIRIEFMPVSGFRGDPGAEYMDIDANGAVLARRQINSVKENSPVVLMGITAFSVVLAVVIISMMTVFKSEDGDPLYVAGRSLWIRAERPISQQFIVHSGADLSGTIHTWAMKPDDEENNVLAYIEVTLINQSSGTVNLVIDESAATLEDGNGSNYDPVNTIVRSYTAEESPTFNVPEFIPMWGTLKVNEGEQVTGMLVFEVPRGSTFRNMRWKASDSAVIRYQ